MDAKLKEFLINVSQDEELKKELLEKLREEATEENEAIKNVAVIIAEFAKEKGCEIDENVVLKNIQNIDDEVLDDISGGRIVFGPNGKLILDCTCIMGGSGEDAENLKRLIDIFKS